MASVLSGLAFSVELLQYNTKYCNIAIFGSANTGVIRGTSREAFLGLVLLRVRDTDSRNFIISSNLLKLSSQLSHQFDY